MDGRLINYYLFILDRIGETDRAPDRDVTNPGLVRPDPGNDLGSGNVQESENDLETENAVSNLRKTRKKTKKSSRLILSFLNYY